MSEKEIAAWAGYVPLSAVHNFGLSETTPAQIPRSASLSSLGPDLPQPELHPYHPEERQAVPQACLLPHVASRANDFGRTTRRS